MRKREAISNFVPFYYHIHQEVIVTKLINSELQNVMQMVVRVVNFTVSRTLNHLLLRQLLEDHESENGDLMILNEGIEMGISWQRT